MEDRYLFKAKRTDNGEWVIGYYGVIGERNVIIEKYTENYYCPDTCESRHGNQIHEVNSKTICQCTGLKDKNGKLIWENDIVRGKMHGNYGYRKLVGVVQYYIDAFKVNVKPNSFWGDYKNIPNACEVIGNIFDNKELLESEE